MKKKIFEPNSEELNQLISFFNSSNFEEAEEFAQSLINRFPRHGFVWKIFGAILQKLGRIEESLVAKRKAVELLPQDAEAHSNLANAFLEAGLLNEAQQSCHAAIKINAKLTNAHNILGLILQKQGKHDEAVSIFHHVLKINSKFVEGYFHLANSLKEQKEFTQAESNYRTALTLKPDYIDAIYNLAAILDAQNRLSEAEFCYRDILKIKPNFANAHCNLATILEKQDRLPDAIEHCQRALTIDANYAAAANNLGTLLVKSGEYKDSLNYYQKAIDLEPLNSHYIANMSYAERLLKNYARAVALIKNAIKLNPDNAKYLTDYADSLNEWKNNEPSAQINRLEIERLYKKAIECDPHFAVAWNRLGDFYNKDNRDESALEAFQRATELEPSNQQYIFDLATRLHNSGDIDKAKEIFALGLAIKEHTGARIRYATLVPNIMESEDAIDVCRADLLASFQHLLASKVEINDPMLDIAVSPSFYLAYHGKNNCELMRSYAELMSKACPCVNYVAPHCQSPQLISTSGKIRIGFISNFFRNHTIGKFFKGIFEHLSRDNFEIFIFMTSNEQDEVTQSIADLAGHYELLPRVLPQAREQIARHQLDILVYTDIGMEPFTYYLAFSRLAPVQCVFYGHPDTTGISTLDYYLSSGACETLSADSHYTEKLIRLDDSSTYTYYSRPVSRATQKSRLDLNLPLSNHLYTCAQSLFKIHPEMDAVFDDILERDELGVLLLFDDVSQRRNVLFKTRLQKHMRHFNRVIFLPRLQLPDFLQVLHLSDALLDSFHFCGGNTSFDSFASESPVVTLPGEFMRGRQTLGLYQRMGFTDLIAENKADYIEKTLKLGTDAQYRQAMRTKLASCVSVIFEDTGVITALENFFISSTAKNNQIMKTHQTDIFSEFENALVNFKSSPSIPQYKHITDLLLTLENIEHITADHISFLKRMLHECVNVETSWSLFISHFLWTLNANHDDNFNDTWNCARWSGFTYKGSKLDSENHLKFSLELRQKNSSPVCFILLGNAYRALLRFREAEDTYLQGCAYWPNDPFLKLRLADLYLATFRYGLAEPILRFLRPQYPFAREMMFLDVSQESEIPTPIFLDDKNEAIESQVSKYEFIAFIAADSKYLEKYGVLYVQSMQKEHQDRVHFHLHVIHDIDTALPYATFELLKESAKSISFSHRATSIPFENTNLMKSIYASERFLVLPYLLEKIQMPIVMTDIDIECLCDLRHFIHSNTQMDFSVIAPSKDSPEAWEHFNANCLLINPTTESINAFKRIASNIIFQLNHNPLPWFVDQIALFREIQLMGKCRIEQLPINLYDPNYKDAEKLKSSHFRIFHGSWF